MRDARVNERDFPLEPKGTSFLKPFLEPSLAVHRPTRLGLLSNGSVILSEPLIAHPS
jgi:hypothetical protein